MLSDMERGARRITRPELDRLCAALDLDRDEAHALPGLPPAEIEKAWLIREWVRIKVRRKMNLDCNYINEGGVGALVVGGVGARERRVTVIARLITVLVLILAIGSVSWGMRAEAQNETLEARVAALEELTAANNMQITELFSRSLPPLAPPNENEVFGFFNPDPAYAFEVSCIIQPYLMGNGYNKLVCVRFLP